MDLNQLKALATRYNGYLNGDTALYEDLNELSKVTIKALKKNYETDANRGRPVILLRYILLSLLEREITITPETIDKIKDDLKRRNLTDYEFLSDEAKENFNSYPVKTKSPFVNWRNTGSIVFPFFYTDDVKNAVVEQLDTTLDQIVKALNLKEVEKHYVDFNGAQNYGSGRVWGAIYPKSIKSHKNAYQLFFNLSHKGLEAGIAKGHSIVGGEGDDIETITTFDKLAPLFQEKLEKWRTLNTKATEPTKTHKQLEEFKVPLNQIFYGPPGTGKTYTTISEAVKIVEELSDLEFENEYYDRNKLKTVFENYVRKGQIAFSTFHQSMSYEDFVEGIKPLTVETEEAEKKQVTVTYEVKDGIFKELCRNAEGYLSTKKSLEATDESNIKREDFTKGAFYKMSLGRAGNEDDQDIYDYCIKEKVISLGWGHHIDFTNVANESELKSLAKDNGLSSSDIQFMKHFRLYMKEGNFVVISKGNRRIRAIGKVTGAYTFNENTSIDYNHFRKVDWIIKDVDISSNELYEGNIDQKTLYPLDSSSIKQSFFEQFKTQKEKAPDFIRRNFVLIIDEINRGNVSQIFGELITLLEEDKRKGNEEALELTLPYSQKPFGVPNNLFLIGTMNTADRSVETLDTALRRRFMFREMPPIEDLLSPEKAVYELWNIYDGKKEKEYIRKEKALYEFIGLTNDWERGDKIYLGFENEPSISELEEVFKSNDLIISGINLKKLLLVINYRIEKLLDKDHAIGHAYFMHIYKAENPTAALKRTFQKNIIPLLQEYFYGDYGKIGLVLGEAFVASKSEKILSFAKFKNISQDIREDYESRIVYALTPMDSLKKQDFIAIYE